MINIEGLQTNLGEQWIPDIYSDKIKTKRTRSVEMNIPERENFPDILHTLLGVELKVGKLRIACPDLSTARYLRVFARIGCVKTAIPYDITKISAIADELETAWQRMNLILEGVSARTRNMVLRQLREQISMIGAGEAMPEFNQNTKQRKT